MIKLYLHCDLSLEGKVHIFLMVIHWLTMWMHIPKPTEVFSKLSHRTQIPKLKP